MGNCCPTIRFRRSSVTNPKSITLLLVGLDNAGKTTIAKRLSEEPLDGVLPTVGFSRVSLQEKGCNVTVYDLGGGPQIRDIWPRYYADVHGVMFVIDASDIERMNECRKTLEGLLLDSYISGKPVLLLANKQDVEGALDEIDIVDRLNVERLVNQQKCPTLVELCSAGHLSRKMDIGIDNGYRWLLRCITKDYPALNNRVLKDLATQEELERIKRIQREERIRKIKQERETDIQGQNEITVVEAFQPNKEEKPYSNGVIQMKDKADIPGQIHDVSESSEKYSPRAGSEKRVPYPTSYSCEFFKFEKDNSDIMLIRNMDERSDKKNFLVRPKSSGPRLISHKSDTARKRTLRKMSYHRNNKTAPSPVVDGPPITSIPKIFDPIHHTEATTSCEQIQSQDSSLKVKTIAQMENPRTAEGSHTSKSTPNSRKPSAKPGSKRCTSSDGGMSKLGSLPPLKISRRPVSRELILDITQLN